MHRIKGFIDKNLLNNYSKGIKHFEILGIFTSGIYLQDEDENVIMLHDDKYGLIPFGIGLKEFKTIFKKDELNEDLNVYIKDNELTVGETVIELFKEEFKDLSLNEKIIKEEFLDIIKEKLKDIDKGAFKDLIIDGIKENIYSKTLKEALNKKALEEIVGLGPGLTPSGDDFLFGYLYRIFNDHEFKDEAYKEKIKKEIEKLYLNTNLISRTFYKAILNKQKFELFENICFANNKEELEKHLLNLFDVGSNSGVDILCGIAYSYLHLI